jgi:hypothetical protein
MESKGELRWDMLIISGSVFFFCFANVACYVCWCRQTVRHFMRVEGESGPVYVMYTDTTHHTGDNWSSRYSRPLTLSHPISSGFQSHFPLHNPLSLSTFSIRFLPYLSLNSHFPASLRTLYHSLPYTLSLSLI